MKNKFLLMGLIGLTAISLAGVGFATWVVGVQKKDMDTELQVDVDDTQNDSIIVQATMKTEKLIVAQKAKVDRGTGDIIGTSQGTIGYNANALKFTLTNITYMVGNAVEETDKPTKLRVQLKDEKNEFNKTTDEKIKDNGATKYKRTPLSEGNYWTYLNFSEDILLTDFVADPNNDALNSKYKKYVIDTRDFTIGWGTFFGKEMPTKFYNDKFRNESDYDFKFDSGELITQELQAMKAAFASKKVTISLSLIKE